MPGVSVQTDLGPDAYEVLGIPADATEEQIRAAHRRLARAVHPDTGGSVALFVAVQRAYEMLLDPAAAPTWPIPLVAACRCGALPATLTDLPAESGRPSGRHALRHPGSPARHNWPLEILLAAQLTLLGLAALTLLLRH